MRSEAEAINFYGGGGPQPSWFDPRRIYGEGPSFFTRGPGKWILLFVVLAVLSVISLWQAGIFEEQRDNRQPTPTAQAN